MGIAQKFRYISSLTLQEQRPRKSHGIFRACSVALMWVSFMLQPAQAQPLEILPVQGNVYMISSASGNMVFQTGDDGILLVDTLATHESEAVLAAIRTVSQMPIQVIVNTHLHHQRMGGNAWLKENGGHNKDFGRIAFTSADRNVFPVYAHENVLLGAVEDDTIAADLWPTDTYFVDRKELYSNGEAVLLLHQPNAHTDGDTIVHFRGSDVIVVGDLFSTVGYPVFDRTVGGSIAGVIRALGEMLRIIVPARHSEGGTLVVPGTGRISDEADVADYRTMVVIVRDRIRRMAADGLTLQQVIAARPSLEFDYRYGSGEWPPEKFAEEIYLDVIASGQ